MVEDVVNILQEKLPDAQIFPVSAPIHDGTESLQNALITYFDNLPQEEVTTDERVMIDLRTYQDPNSFTVHDISKEGEYRYEIR